MLIRISFKSILLLLFISILFPPLLLAQTKSGYTDVKFTNNTHDEINVTTRLTTSDYQFKRLRDWDGTDIVLKPYETKTILWFSRNRHVKANTNYNFSIKAEVKRLQAPFAFDFLERGKACFGSTLVTRHAMPNDPSKIMLKEKGLERYETRISETNYALYARKFLKKGSVFTHYHLLINQDPTTDHVSLNPHELKILTYNVQLMPFYAGVVDDLNHPTIRAKTIPSKIKKYDVVILEELFDHKLRNEIVSFMVPFYPYHTAVLGQHTKNILTGGVMIFSKWPIMAENELIYRAGTGLDQFAVKGVKYALINKYGVKYHIMGTHAQAGGTPKVVAERNKQFQELANFIKSRAIASNEALLLAGDFNVDEFSSQLKELLGKLNAHAPENHGIKYSCDATLNTMMTNSSRVRLDYVLFSKAHLQPINATNKVIVLRGLENEKMWPKFDLSDHFSVEGYFKFNE